MQLKIKFRQRVKLWSSKLVLFFHCDVTNIILYVYCIIIIIYSLDTEIINKCYHQRIVIIDKFNRILCKKC